MTFTPTYYTLTEGQPVRELCVSSGVFNEDQTELDFRTGRKKSKPPAQDFMRDIGDINVASSYQIWHLHPTKMNFAFEGHLEMKFEGNITRRSPIRIGQDSETIGTISTDMMWWLGGPYCQVQDAPKFASGGKRISCVLKCGELLLDVSNDAKSKTIIVRDPEQSSDECAYNW